MSPDDLPPLWPPALGHNGGPPLDGQEPRRPGRPTVFTPELREAILDNLAVGVSLRAICRAEGMPGRATIYRWRGEDAAFDKACRSAQEFGYQMLVEEVVIESVSRGDQDGCRIASPEMLPTGDLLPHVICSPPVFAGGGEHEADQHDDA